MQTRLAVQVTVFFAVWCAVLVPAIAYAAAQADATSEIEALRKENAELRAKCQDLEARLALVEAQQPRPDTQSLPATGESTAGIGKEDNGQATATKAGLMLNLNEFLLQMDGFADRYEKADTSVLKDDVLKQMFDTAEALVKDKTLPDITAKIKDVQTKQDGLTTVSLIEVRMPALERIDYLRRGQQLLKVSTLSSTASTVLKMPADDARKLKPGQQVRLSGAPMFIKPQNLGAWGPGSLTILHFKMNDAYPLHSGKVVMRLRECRIGSVTYDVQ